MRRWIELAAALYPARWRQEYGEEFWGVLDNVQPNWRTFGNVLWGAIVMQITKGTGWLKWMAITAAVGAALAGALSFTVQPVKYVSVATMQVKPVPDPLRPAPPNVLQQRAADNLAMEEQEVLSRTTLEGVIEDPSLDLYKEERQHMPIEKIVERVRRDIRLQILPPEGGALKPIVFSVSFNYPNPAKAQAVTKTLAMKFTEQNRMVNRNQAHLYQAFWDDQARRGETKPVPPPPVGDDLVVVSLPSLPHRADGQNRVAFIAIGTGAGALLGVLLSLARQKRRGGWMLAGTAVAGFLLGGATSFLIPDRYTSTAIMRVTPPQVMADPLATPPVTGATELLRHLDSEILNRENLKRMILMPRLDLYHDERARQPLDQVAGKMLERDLRIAPVSLMGVPGYAGAFCISFTYSDPRKAQQTVRDLVTQFTEWNVMEVREKARYMSDRQQQIEEHKAGENLEVLDPASLPEEPVAPNRAAIAGAGLALGILAGTVALLRRPRASTAQAS
jgi:succinoglycan biosynthesis transport protein ExoP